MTISLDQRSYCLSPLRAAVEESTTGPNFLLPMPVQEETGQSWLQRNIPQALSPTGLAPAGVFQLNEPRLLISEINPAAKPLPERDKVSKKRLRSQCSPANYCRDCKSDS